VKHKLIRGLALTLGVCTVPGIASAQYSIAPPNASGGTAPAGNVGSGLSGGVYLPLTPPSVTIPTVTVPQVTVPQVTVPQMAVPQVQANQGFGFPVAVPSATYSPVGYQQNAAVGSGLVSGIVEVSSQNPYGNPASLLTQPASPQERVVPQSIGPSTVAQGYAVPGQPYSYQASPTDLPTAMNAATGHNHVDGNCATCGTGSVDTSCGTTSYSLTTQTLCPWIFGSNALLFNRVDDEYTRLSSDSNMPSEPLLSTNDVRMPTTGGFELFGGRYFGCGRYAIVGSYWGLFSPEQSYTVTTPSGGNLRSNLPFTLQGPNIAATPYGITMPVENVYNWYDGAYAHQVTRDQDFQNVEINFLSFALGGGARQPYPVDCNSGCGTGWGSRHQNRYSNPCNPSISSPTGPCAPWYGAQCSKLRLNMYGGLRWFQFRDYLQYATSSTDAMFGSTADDFYYRNNVTNDLFGGQLGGLATWCTGCRVNLWSGANVGVYNNHINATSYAGTTSDAATVLSSNSFNGQPYNLNSSINDVAVLGELNSGVGLRVTRGWSANVGYRIIGVSGVATSVGQIPRDFSLLNDASRINNNRSLILNGLTVGAAYNF